MLLITNWCGVNTHTFYFFNVTLSYHVVEIIIGICYISGKRLHGDNVWLK